MASLEALTKVYSLLAVAYGKPPAWPREQAAACMKLLGAEPDAVLERELVAWLDEDPENPPKLSQLRAKLRARRVATADHVPGCGKCSVEGFRSVAWHHTGKADEAQVHTFAVPCDCPRGTHRARMLSTPREGEPRVEVLALGRWCDARRDQGSTLAIVVDPRPSALVPRGTPAPPHRYVGTSLGDGRSLAEQILAHQQDDDHAAERGRSRRLEAERETAEEILY